MEDRFLIYSQMIDVSDALEAAGFKHVVAVHRIDPEWRATHRSSRPELEPVAYTVRLDEYLTPMPQIKKLIAICEERNLTFWIGGTSGDPGEGPEIYFKIRHASSDGTP